MGLFDSVRRLFGGKPQEPGLAAAEAGIEAFWAWWSGAQQELLATVANGLTPDLIRAMSERVAAIHPKLGWEFGKGEGSLHRLALTGEGDGRVRVFAERWRARGPGDDDTWAFHATKPPVARDSLAQMALGVGGHQVDFADVRVAIAAQDGGARLLDVEVWHPAFPELPEAVRGQVTFLVLDAAVGEDAVERWLGVIEPVASAPGTTVDLGGLRERVDELASRVAEASWALGTGPDPATGQGCVFAVDQSVKRWDHPLHDTRVVVRLPYGADEHGMPADPDVVPVFDALEDDLVATLGADAVYVCRRTGAGERWLWLYVDGAAGAADRIRTWAASCGRPCSVEVEADPLWEGRPG